MLIRLAFFMLLVACTPSDRLLRTYNDDTGVWQTLSRDTEVYGDGQDHAIARTIILEAHAAKQYYLSLSFLHRRGSRPRILGITQDGRPLGYEMYDRFTTFCIDHCHKAEIGQIQMTQAQFKRAALSGMVLHITGQRRDYVAHVPARLFASVLGAAHQPEMTANALP